MNTILLYSACAAIESSWGTNVSTKHAPKTINKTSKTKRWGYTQQKLAEQLNLAFGNLDINKYVPTHLSKLISYTSKKIGLK